MLLTPEQQQQAIQYLNTNWVGQRNCAVCNQNQWTVHPELYELRQFSNGGLTVGGPIVPLLMVECQHCGNTITLNAMRAGLINQEVNNGQ